MSQEIGLIGEQQARNYLEKRGLRWIMSNYHCRWGEVDLIMDDGEYRVFVEVRARVSAEYGGAIGSITMQKRIKIMKTAQHYMVAKKLYEKYPMRFDMVSIQGVSAKIEWIKDAFGANY